MSAKTFPVESGQIMMFARAVGDPNPVYSDDGYAARRETGGIIAPPTFVISSAHYDPAYDRRPKPGVPWFGSGREPIGSSQGPFRAEGGGGFHAEQHFEYHRHVQPGDVLSVETRAGRTWEKQGRRGGKLTFIETITEYRDERGQLVVTSRAVDVATENTVD